MQGFKIIIYSINLPSLVLVYYAFKNMYLYNYRYRYLTAVFPHSLTLRAFSSPKKKTMLIFLFFFLDIRARALLIEIVKLSLVKHWSVNFHDIKYERKIMSEKKELASCRFSLSLNLLQV